ncbi:MAG: hypothetical protein ABIL09_12575 [Gemmatimonadota bacterium]
MKYLGLDQYGHPYLIREHPRQELLEQLGRRHAAKMYRDVAGRARHCGYVIAGLWIDVFAVQPFLGKA